MRGTRTLVLAFGLVVAACGGSADSTSTTEAPSTTAASGVTTVTSDDGIIEVGVPADAGAEVTVGTASEVPEEFEDIDLIGPVYVLGPAGATFDTPVHITATFDADNDPDDHPVNLAFPVLLSADGTIDTLDDLEIEFDADGAVVSGTTTHFSELVFVSIPGVEFMQVALDPVLIMLPVGDSFEAVISSRAFLGGGFTPGPQVSVSEWTVGNPIVLSGGGTVPETSGLTTSFTCEEAGSSSYSANVQVREWSSTVSDALQIDLPENPSFDDVVKGVLEAIETRPSGNEPTITISGDLTISGIVDCVEDDPADALCAPDLTADCDPEDCPPDPDGVICGGIELAGYTLVVRGQPVDGSRFDFDACVKGPDGMPAAGWEIYFSKILFNWSPGDPEDEHYGPIILGSNGCTMASFNDVSSPSALLTSFMGEVGQFGESNENGEVILFGGSPL